MNRRQACPFLLVLAIIGHLFKGPRDSVFTFVGLPERVTRFFTALRDTVVDSTKEKSEVAIRPEPAFLTLLGSQRLGRAAVFT